MRKANKTSREKKKLMDTMKHDEKSDLVTLFLALSHSR